MLRRGIAGLGVKSQSEGDGILEHGPGPCKALDFPHFGLRTARLPSVSRLTIQKGLAVKPVLSTRGVISDPRNVSVQAAGRNPPKDEKPFMLKLSEPHPGHCSGI